jgi:hypothetical protein
MGERREMLRAVGGRMATKAIETAGSLDQATLDALREGIAAVLVEQSSTARSIAPGVSSASTSRAMSMKRRDCSCPRWRESSVLLGASFLEA